MPGSATVREASFGRTVILGTCAALALSAGCTTTYISQGRRSTDPNTVYEAAEEPPTRASGRPSRATRASGEINEGRPAPTRAPATAQLSLAEIDLPALARRWRNGAKGDLRLLPILDAAERAASAPGRQVLRTGRRLALRERKVFRGSCWSFATAVYGEAGFARKRRRRPFKSKSKGPYVDINAIQPGDFLSYINHSYNRGVHSAIFVAWLDKGRAEALMLSYVGGRRARPGGYRSYRLTDVYSIIRPRK
jgi:hypothetical protein